jgi:hypothetical protein
MATWLSDGRAIDLLLVLIAIEAAVLLLVARRPPAVAVSDWLYCLLAGSLLLVALRLALAQLSWHWIALSLALAGLAHIADVRRRFIR